MAGLRRGVSELYAALLLLALAVALAVTLQPWLANLVKASEREPRPVLVVEINETHVVCYTPTPVNLTYWRLVGAFECWLVPSVNETALLSCPEILPPDTYVLVTPPWLCG